MMKQICSAAVLLFITHPGLAAPGPVSTPAKEEIREAIKELDHSQYRVRTLAAKKLLAAGADAIEPLANAAETGSAEVSDRAMKILQDLAFGGSEASMLATREALRRLANSKSAAREPAREILKLYRGRVLEIFQASGARLQFDGDKLRAIYLNDVMELDKVLPLLREFPEITEVSAATKKFGDAEMKHLQPLTKLKWLNLFESDIGDEALKVLKNFPDLESVPMGHTRVTDAGLKHLADLIQLNYVGLRGNNVTDVGLVHLKKLTNLTGLTLEETKVTGTGFVHLQEMTHLNHLRLRSAPIVDEGLDNLHGIKSLRVIDLGDTKVTDKAVQRLRDQNLDLLITRTTNQ